MVSWPGALILLVALAFALALRTVVRIPQLKAHNAALDGFRGYLAFGVFLHHSMVWYFFVHQDDWSKPPLPVYRDLGVYCVGFFFMITAFLFGGKVIDGRYKPINWAQLYVSRVLRIVPLFWVVTSCLLVLVGVASRWQLRETWGQLAQEILKWASAGMVEGGVVNGFLGTTKLVALVTWTLMYEWWFYFSLPLLALIVGVRVRPGLLALSAGAVIAISLGILHPLNIVSFLVGIVVACVVRNPRAVQVLRTTGAGAIAVGALILLLSGRVPHYVAPGVEALAFMAVAGGNTLFGALSNRAAIALGEISYGVYLMHGLVLATMFWFVIGTETVQTWTPARYWLQIGAASLVVVTLATLSYRFIELPAVSQAQSLTRSLAGFASRLRGTKAS